MARLIRWEYKGTSEAWVDGDWGRYYIRRRAKGSRDFIVLLNDKRTAYWGDNRDQAVSAAVRAIKANYPEYN